jgi:hypothetical protein
MVAVRMRAQSRTARRNSGSRQRIDRGEQQVDSVLCLPGSYGFLLRGITPHDVVRDAPLEANW